MSKLSSYKQWSGEVRAAMYAKYTALKKAGDLPLWLVDTGPCSMCGETHGTMPHAEDYGPSFEDYLRALHVLCGLCHSMLHLRYGYKGQWSLHCRYVLALRRGEVERKKPIHHMGVIFGQAKGWPKLPDRVEVIQDGEWWQALPY